VAAAGLEDRANVAEVQLAHDAMVLADADAAAMDAGANLAVLGEELLQFAHAEPLGANRWRLSGLWRGRRGTEDAIGMQAVGDRFVLIAADSIRSIDLPDAAIGTAIRLMAEGPGDTAGPVEADVAIGGLSVVPPSPVHLAATRDEDGGASIRWVRRSRNGWRWIDGADAPLGEEAERYRVTVSPEGGSERTLETGTPLVSLTAEEAAAGATVSVRQAGSHGLSRVSAIVLPALD
jgi:hypothetical protein